MSTRTFLKNVLIFFVFLKISNAVDPCQTPSGKYGECKSIEECQPFYRDYIENSADVKKIENIRRSYCGFLKNTKIPKVCCPTLPEIRATPENWRTPVVNSSLLSRSCGLGTANFIYGGTVTDLAEFPWMARLDFELDEFGTRGYKCGGSLINNRYILTAAHCVNSSLVSVRLGEYDVSKTIDCIDDECAPPPIDIEIEEKIVFESYDLNDVSTYHDIALLRLKQEVIFSDFIAPICLPTTFGEIFNQHLEERLTVAGWGKTEYGYHSNIKLKVDALVKDCSRRGKIVTDCGQICAGEWGKDSCAGDSGGPLMDFQLNTKKRSHAYVIGVVSIGPQACGRHTPAIYTKVSKYIYWIIDNLKP